MTLGPGPEDEEAIPGEQGRRRALQIGEVNSNARSNWPMEVGSPGDAGITKDADHPIY